MSLISWNCQGVRQALIKCMLRELNHIHCPSLVSLIETKGKKNKVEMIRRCLGFKNSFYVDLEAKARGVALWWTDEVEI